MGEAIGKLVTLAVDSLTPRGVRILTIALALGNGYGWWLHDQRLKRMDDRDQERTMELVGLRADVRAWMSKADEGNAELKAIRQWLIQNGNGRR